MKRNSKNIITGFFAVLSIIFLLSCVNDAESVFQDNGSHGIVELADLPARSTSTPYSLKSTALEADDIAKWPITVNYTGANGAPEDITVTLKFDAKIIETHNDQDTIKENDYTELPSHLFDVDSYTVVIPKGEKKAVFTINVFPPEYTEDDFFESYALGISIESVTSGIISGNYGKGVFPIGIKNKYDGVYTVEGSFQDYTNAAFVGVYPLTVHLVTTSASTVEVHLKSIPAGTISNPYRYYFYTGSGYSYYGNWSPIFKFDTTTNKAAAVTNYYGQGTNASGRAGEIEPEANNYYDPETKSVHITYYLIQSGAKRSKFTEVYTYKESR